MGRSAATQAPPVDRPRQGDTRSLVYVAASGSIMMRYNSTIQSKQNDTTQCTPGALAPPTGQQVNVDAEDYVEDHPSADRSNVVLWHLSDGHTGAVYG